MGDQITVTISKWDKFNVRKDYTNPRWFAMSNRLLEDEDFLRFSAEEIKAWIYILSKASQKNCATVRLDVFHANQVCRIKPLLLKSTIKRLSDMGTISVQDSSDARTHSALYREEQNKTENNKTKHFDLELVYQKYPRRVGKQKGMDKLKAQIQTQKDFDDLTLALSHYVDHCRLKQTEEKFIKHFSTWVSEWRDWIDPSTGSGADFKHSAIDDLDLSGAAL